MKNDVLYIVMPAYNEEANVDTVVAQWHPVVEKVGGNSRLLIVNDGSKDNTYKKLQSLQVQYPLLLPIDKANSGHGATCLFAYQKAIEANADYIFQTDSDGQTDPGEFWHFWENRNKYHFIIGSRDSRQDGIGRIFVTRVLRWVVWLMFGEWIKDANTPFRLMKAEKLALILKFIPEDFFLANVAISVIAVKKKEKCKWLPITFKPRQGGINSINMKRIFKIGRKALVDFKSINEGFKKTL